MTRKKITIESQCDQESTHSGPQGEEYVLLFVNLNGGDLLRIFQRDRTNTMYIQIHRERENESGIEKF